MVFNASIASGTGIKNENMLNKEFKEKFKKKKHLKIFREKYTCLL